MRPTFELDPYTARDQIALDKLFVRRRPGVTITVSRATTVAHVTPRADLERLARKGLISFLDAPRVSNTFGEPGWVCSLTEYGRYALSTPLRKDFRPDLDPRPASALERQPKQGKRPRARPTDVPPPAPENARPRRRARRGKGDARPTSATRRQP